MNKAKIYFSLALFLIAGILILGSLNKVALAKVNAFNIVTELVDGELQEYSLAEAKTYQCTIEKHSDRTIILRVDDITPWNDLRLMKRMTEDLLSRDYGVSLGVIPHGIGADRDLVRWVQKVNANSDIELSLHGYRHEEDEFKTLSYDQAKIKIELGRDIMIKYFGEIPINFIPPYNVESDGTIQALKDLGFKTFSGSVKEYIIEDTFARAGYTTATYKYSEDIFIYSHQVLEECKIALDKNGICVIMFHPQDFTTNGKTDEAKYAEYIKVLDGLKDFNADVVNFREAFCREYRSQVQPIQNIPLQSNNRT